MWSQWLAHALQAAASIETSCELSTGTDKVEAPWVMYNDLRCVGDTGLVDDQAIFEARAQMNMEMVDNVSTAVERYVSAKVVGKLERPAGTVLGGGELMWMEQDLGVVRKCSLSDETGRCSGEATVVLDGLHCPEDFAVDFHRGRIYVIQHEGKSAADQPTRCFGTPRIIRAALSRGADGDRGQTVVVSDGMGKPTMLALDPLGGPGQAGYLFWTDLELFAVMRSDLDGGEQLEVVHDARPSGIAIDPSRASIYYTSAERGAGLTWSNYDGRYPPPRSVIPQGERVFFEPVALALNAADGSVYVVQANTYVEGCDPTTNAGHGAVTCDEREQGRISRVSCAWPARHTLDGAPAAPHECCCHDPSAPTLPCKLLCSPPAPSLPPSTPQGGGPGAAFPPSLAAPLTLDYTRMVWTDELVLDVGGLVYGGMQSTPWGEPKHITLMPAVRLLATQPGEPRTLGYGNCSTGCGRPAGSDGCRICLPGSYGTGEGVCRLCVAGKYGNASISRASSATEACIKCDEGKFVASYGAAACAACPIGHVCTDAYVLAADLTLQPVPSTGSIPLPTACPRGTYNPSEGAAEPAACLLCAAGRYRNSSGGTNASSCKACLPGYFASAPGASVCDACGPSTYQPAAASASCEQCPAGFFSLVDAATACEECRAGTFGEADRAGSRCVECPMGTYSNATAATECLLCPVNTLGATLGAASLEGCEQCSEGFFNLVEGSSECDACPTKPVFNETTFENEPPPNGCVFESAAPKSRRVGWLPVLAALGASILCTRVQEFSFRTVHQ